MGTLTWNIVELLHHKYKGSINKLGGDRHGNYLFSYEDITVIDSEITVTTSYNNCAEMHRWVTQTCSNSQQKQLPQSFFFFFFFFFSLPNWDRLQNS